MAGRGAGKTVCGAYDLICRAKSGRTYLIGSPTGVMMFDTTFPTFRRIAQDLGVWGGVKLTPYPNVTLTTGATVRFRTAEDPEKMRGPNLSGIWLDEASLMEREAYTVCIAALREGGERGWMSLTFTPKGLTHWTYDLFGRPGPDVALIHARTTDNPWLPAEFTETIRRQYTDGLARQELEGEFVAIEGAEWPAEYFDRPDFWFTDWPEALVVRTLALDPSKGRTDKPGDYCAFIRYGRDAAGLEYVEADLGRWDADVLVERGAQHGHEFRPDGFGVEANAFQHLFRTLFQAEFRKRQLDTTLYMIDNTTAKPVRIRRLTEPLRSRRVRFRDTLGTRLLVAQLRDWPLGDHDDGPDALEMARRLAVELFNGRQAMRARG